MERCLSAKHSLRFALAPFIRHRPSSSVGGFARIVAAASTEDFGLHWQPSFRLKESELMADAPCLLKTCGDFDWKAQATELRAIAQLSIRDAFTVKELPSSMMPGRDVGESSKDSSPNTESKGTWFAAGLALATAALLQITFHTNALAEEDVVQKSQVAADAAARAPSWLTPAFLAFPVVSYAVFYVYRSQVNPDARVSDWMFGVAATVIIANLVLISTLGVRLY